MKLTKKKLDEIINVKELKNCINDDNPNTMMANLDLIDKFIQELKKPSTEKFKAIKEDAKNYATCSNIKCQKLFKKDKSVEWKLVIYNEISYRDAGYGDDDRYVDNEYYVQFNTCPYCKKQVAIEKHFKRHVPGTEKDRWGKVYR